MPVAGDHGKHGVSFLRPPDDRIVVFGQSCAGKTTFALRLSDHVYRCFDALFPWHDLEGLGLSYRAALDHVRNSCGPAPYVLDGWHLADAAGDFLPEGACVYVVYATYDQVVGQYRVPVTDHEEFRAMHERWYRGVDYARLPGTRFFVNRGDFVEVSFLPG